MLNKPQIRIIQADGIEQVEDRVNSWINNSGIQTTIINMNIMPIMLKGKVLFLGIVTYEGEPYELKNEMVGTGDCPEAKEDYGTGGKPGGGRDK